MSAWFPPPEAEADPQLTQRSAARSQRQVQVSQRRRKGLAAGITLLAAIGVAIVTLVVVLPTIEGWRTPAPKELTDYPGPGEGSASIIVKTGDGGAAIAKTLKDAQVVATADAFIKAYGASSEATSLQPGIYYLSLHMKASDALRAMLDPDNSRIYRFTIPEGYRAKQIFQVINKELDIPIEDLEAAAADPALIGLPEQAKGDVEGWLFPATYVLDPNPTAVEALAPMIEQTVKELETLNVKQTKWRKTIILASVVEKESKLDDDRAKVARVYLNRVKADMPWQSDATASYGVQKFDKVMISQADLDDDNKWNTRVKKGYPGGAICNPGAKSLYAAVNPEPGKWLYHVAVDLETGATKFAETEAEFAVIYAEMQDWLDQHPGDW